MRMIYLYGLAAVLLALSFHKSKKKTKMALKKAWKSFSKIFPALLGILILVGVLLAVFDADLITKIIGEESGWIGVVLSAAVGAITLIPGFIAFPTASVLLDNGAGYMQIGAFISALMMVGIATAPMEAEYFGKRLTLVRNLMGFVFSFIVAFVIGKVVGNLWL
jgi:uncharacterized membrane protein YraQ (UPF0718 family)